MLCLADTSLHIYIDKLRTSYEGLFFREFSVIVNGNSQDLVWGSWGPYESLEKWRKRKHVKHHLLWTGQHLYRIPLELQSRTLPLQQLTPCVSRLALGFRMYVICSNPDPVGFKRLVVLSAFPSECFCPILQPTYCKCISGNTYYPLSVTLNFILSKSITIIGTELLTLIVLMWRIGWAHNNARK